MDRNLHVNCGDITKYIMGADAADAVGWQERRRLAHARHVRPEPTLPYLVGRVNL